MRGLSVRIVDSYGGRLVLFEDWCGNPALEASQEQAAAWQASCARADAGRRTLYHNRCALTFLVCASAGVANRG